MYRLTVMALLVCIGLLLAPVDGVEVCARPDSKDRVRSFFKKTKPPIVKKVKPA